jgi:type VI secretion system secreted protein Hcp
MAYNAFARIDQIEGESRDKDYTGWIELIDFGLGVRQTISNTASSAGGASVERVYFSPFLFRKQVDTASPQLALACAAGTHMDETVVALCRAGSDKVKFMEYRLRNCIISKFRAYGGHECGYAFPTESVGIHYGQIQWRYIRQNRQGGGAMGSYVTGWNLQRDSRI